MLAVTRKKTLQRFLQGRFTDAPDRRAQRYLENFDAIWQLQESLLDDAHRANIPVIINDDRDSTLTRIMRVITAAVAACPTSQAATNTDRSG
jgi:2-phosphoglycerate kinase